MASVARCLRSHVRPAFFRLAVAVPSSAAPRAVPVAAVAAAARLSARSFSTTRTSLQRRYTKDHEWVDLSADRKTGAVGISQYAAEKLGDVVYVELPEAGNWIQQGDGLGAVESVKSASDINSPISCKVTQVNSLLEEKPSTINAVPEDDSNGGGWIAKIDVDEKGAKEFDDLMDAKAYEAFIDK